MQFRYSTSLAKMLQKIGDGHTVADQLREQNEGLRDKNAALETQLKKHKQELEIWRERSIASQKKLETTIIEKSRGKGKVHHVKKKAKTKKKAKIINNSKNGRFADLTVSDCKSSERAITPKQGRAPQQHRQGREHKPASSSRLHSPAPTLLRKRKSRDPSTSSVASLSTSSVSSSGHPKSRTPIRPGAALSPQAQKSFESTQRKRRRHARIHQQLQVDDPYADDSDDSAY